MLEFIEQHRNFIFTILPDFLRNKWTMMVLNIIIFVFFIKIANIFIEKFLDRICRFKDDFEFKKQLVTLKSIVKSIVYFKRARCRYKTNSYSSRGFGCCSRFWCKEIF